MATSLFWQPARATSLATSSHPSGALAAPVANDASRLTGDDTGVHRMPTTSARGPNLSVPRAPSARQEDWSRESCPRFAWQPSRQLLRAVRDYNTARERGGMLGSVQRKVAVLRHRFWSAVTGADVPLNSARIAGGLLMPHPNGVVVHPEAVIGPNCVLFQQVTVGTGPLPGVPKIGGNVDIGPGAKILGGVTIGDGAVIGANAVVLNDVPAGAVAVGIPAVTKRIISRPR